MKSYSMQLWVLAFFTQRIALKGLCIDGLFLFIAE